MDSIITELKSEIRKTLEVKYEDCVVEINLINDKPDSANLKYGKYVSRDGVVKWEKDQARSDIFIDLNRADLNIILDTLTKINKSYNNSIEIKERLYTEKEVRGFVFQSYNLRTEDKYTRSTNDLNEWFDKNK